MSISTDYKGIKELEKYQVDVPEGKSGEWRVERFDISFIKEAALANIRDSTILPGTYTRLMLGRSWDNPIMSDTVKEIRDHLTIIHNAEKHVLINGLGLGMVAQACLLKSEVEKVTVVELEEDVIKLVAPHLKNRFGDKLEIIHCSAFDYKPPKGVRYGAVWSDIWPNICSDNWSEYKVLKRKYSRKTDWYGAWEEDRVKYLSKDS